MELNDVYGNPRMALVREAVRRALATNYRDVCLVTIKNYLRWLHDPAIIDAIFVAEMSDDYSVTKREIVQLAVAVLS
jgi:hypothetical protein